MSQVQAQIRQPDVRNRLLAGLPPGDFALLAPSLRRAPLEFGRVLHAPDQPIAWAYFPEAGMVSMVAALEDGAMQEVGVVWPSRAAASPSARPHRSRRSAASALAAASSSRSRSASPGASPGAPGPCPG